MSREDERKYRGDVDYEVWRSGGNTDAIDYDRVEDHRWDGYTAEENAQYELRRQWERQSEPIEEEGT